MTIGQRLIDAMGEHKMSQNALSERIGVSRQTVNKWVKDQVEMPVKTVIKLCDLLDISADWLLMGKSSSTISESMLHTKDMQIFFLEQALSRAEAKIDELNQRIGGFIGNPGSGSVTSQRIFKVTKDHKYGK